jgi:hypothetical protein
MQCVYLGQDTERKHNGLPIHDCQIHGQCLQSKGDASIPACDSCSKRLTLDSPFFNRQWLDPLKVYDRNKQETTGLRNLLNGRSAFLVCGGPSAKKLPLELLNQRGCFTLAVNNAAGYGMRPQAFVCTDPPSKFSHSIWLDPGIMKFIPTPKLLPSRGGLRVKGKDGKFYPMTDHQGQKRYTMDCPNVWGFLRRKWLKTDDSFFLDEGASAGNFDYGASTTGENKTVCTMLVGMRLLRYLGASTVFLVGVDFNMDINQGTLANYSFPQKRDQDACNSNNSQFRIVNDWLVRLELDGVFKRFGIEFYNCNMTSGLRAFPYMKFEYAVNYSTQDVEQKPDLGGWYDPVQ